MGCFQSRLDRRNVNSSDYNTVATAFLGGNKDEVFDNFPVDRVLAGISGEAEPADFIKAEDDFKLGDETQTTDFFKKTHSFVTDHLKGLSDKHGEAADAKDVYLGDKYTVKETLDQLKEAVKLLEASGIDTGAKPAEEGEKKEGEGEGEGEKKDDEMNEGGDENAEAMVEGMGTEEMGGSMQKPNPFTYDKDDRSYDGWNNVAAALLKNMLVNPVFGDMLKANAVSWEFNQEKTKAYDGLTQAAALVSAAAAKAASGENNVFISGYVDNDSFEALGDLVKESNPIHFPFVTAGWGSKDEALNAFDHTSINPKKKDDYKKVLFEVTGAASFSFAGCRQLVHRLNGAIKGGDEADGVHTFQVEAKKLDAQTVAEWKKAKEAPPAAAAAPAEEEKPKEDDKPAEGEGEGDAKEGM